LRTEAQKRMSNQVRLYAPFAPAEDRATLGSDPSAYWSLETAGRAVFF